MRHLVIVLFLLASVGPAAADEAPIAGTVKAVDVVGKTLTVEAPATGRPPADHLRRPRVATARAGGSAR